VCGAWAPDLLELIAERKEEPAKLRRYREDVERVRAISEQSQKRRGRLVR
jgi:hypothetical protein